jgi:hypothetical protein
MSNRVQTLIRLAIVLAVVASCTTLSLANGIIGEICSQDESCGWYFPPGGGVIQMKCCQGQCHLPSDNQCTITIPPGGGGGGSEGGQGIMCAFQGEHCQQGSDHVCCLGLQCVDTVPWWMPGNDWQCMPDAYNQG